MTIRLLPGQICPAGPRLSFLDGLDLALARTHEFCGPARRTLALIVAGRTQGPVIWIMPDWARDRLHGAGVVELLDPGRLILVSPRRAEDLLWSMEEGLRAGCAPLVVCELPDIPGLTPVRRLHLAAETGQREQGGAPLGLLLIAGNGGAPGIESRWHMAQIAGGWRLERRRARTQPPMAWNIQRRDGKFMKTPASDMAFPA